MNKNNKIEPINSRLIFFVILIFSLGTLLLLRLGYLQIAEFHRYQTLSQKNQMTIIPIAPTRGIILDKNGVVLAENIPVYVLEIIPESVKNLSRTLTELKRLIPSLSEEDIETFNKARNQNRSFVPIPLKLKLTQEEVANFATNQYRFPGVNIKARLMRYYPLGEITAHLLGYVGRINIQELQEVDPQNYRGTDFIGKAGVEKYYEPLLHGKVGYQQVETDVSGRTIRILSQQNPNSGEKIYLTIDAQLQKIAYEAMKDKRGAVVALQSGSGDVLAMVSTPSFDPNLFVNGITQFDYQRLSNATERPLYNRAVRGLYPPASTIKPYIALAGLENGITNTQFHIFDPGWFRLPNVTRPFRDWKKNGHGFIDLKRAIAVSCDTYFYHLGYKMGINAMANMLRQFGFGQPTHIDLFEELPGLLPTKDWKISNKGMPWFPGDTVITSIGQGFMLASPLQLATAVATISQQGKRLRPHLILKSVEVDHGQTKTYKPIVEKEIVLRNPSYWQIVTEGMQAVILSNEGTGYRFGRNPPYSVAAKTGTAQVFGGKQYEKRRHEVIPEFLRDHSLFIAFAPVENPEIAIAVMVENDVLASNVARKILDAYFELKKQAPEHPIESITQ